MTKVTFVVRFQKLRQFSNPDIFWSANQKRSSKSDSSTLLNSDSLSFFLFYPLLMHTSSCPLSQNQPPLPWVVQKYGGTSVGKFINAISTKIIP
jgi:hypothetical protein